MTDLTQDWKDGKLPAGWYYIKIADIVFIDFFEGKVWKNKKDEYIDEVLAPVPSYEEWQASYNCMLENEVLRLKNAQLKELLKEYKKYLSEIKNAYIDLTTQDEYGSYYIDEAKLFVEIVGKTIKDFDEHKIDNTIGEK